MRTTEQTYTPVPWFAHGDGWITAGGDSGADVLIAKIEDENSDGMTVSADARLIVTAVNHHAELVDFLKEIARVSCECDGMPQACSPCRARALLSRIKGRTDR